MFSFIKFKNKINWSLDQMILPHADIDDNKITIFNIRNFKYRSTSDYDPYYYNKTFDLSKIKSVDFVIEPFSKFRGAAHTFLSFGFENNEYISISIEIRKKIGQEFSALKGFFNWYDIMYVIADENDAIKLRSNYRKDKVYIYPIKISKTKNQALFLHMINKANKLKEKPEYYNTITNTCATNIARHINAISPKMIPFSYKILMPGYIDQLVFDLKIIDTHIPLSEAQKKFLINDRAIKYADHPDFSQKIRDLK